MRQILIFAAAVLIVGGYAARFADKAVKRPRRRRRPCSRSSSRARASQLGQHRMDARRATATAISASMPASTAAGIDFMVDTGASLVTLRESDAGRCRHPPDAARLHRDRLHRQRQDQGGARQARRASRSATSPCSTCRRWCCRTRRCRRTCSASRSCPGCGATNTPTAAWCWSSSSSRNRPRHVARTALRGSRRWGMHMNVATRRFEALMFPTPKSVADAQYLRLRVLAAGEADRLPRIRRALAAGKRNQPDGRAGARHGARQADPRARRQAGDRHRPRFPQLFGLGEDGAGLRPDGGGLQGARHRAGDHADGLFRAVRARTCPASPWSPPRTTTMAGPA